MKQKLFLIITLMILVSAFALADPNDPFPFGNDTTDTAWIGGSEGIGNFSGNVYASALFMNDSIVCSQATGCGGGSANVSGVAPWIIVTGSDISWNESQGNLSYVNEVAVSNLNVNSSTFANQSSFWANLTNVNLSMFDKVGSILNIDLGFLDSLYASLVSFNSLLSNFTLLDSRESDNNVTQGVQISNLDTAIGDFINSSDESTLNVNSSNFWDDIGSINFSVFSSSGGVLNIVQSFFSNLFYLKTFVYNKSESYNTTVIDSFVSSLNSSQQADNSTLAAEISALDTKVGLVNDTSVSDNTTQAALISTNIGDISTLDSRESNNNITQATAIGLRILSSEEGNLNVNHSETSGTASIATSWDGETSQSNLNVNSSNFWDGLNIINSSMFVQVGSTLNVLQSYLTNLFHIKSVLYIASVIDSQHVVMNTTQSDDNSTQAGLITTNINDISTLDSREASNNVTQAAEIVLKLDASDQRYNETTALNNQITQQGNDNDTQGVLITTNIGDISALDTRESNNNATQAALIVTNINDITTETALQAANNITQAAEIQNRILTSNEGNLNVNNSLTSDSTTLWASVSSFINKWFYDNANVLTFNETQLTFTIDDRIAAGRLQLFFYNETDPINDSAFTIMNSTIPVRGSFGITVFTSMGDGDTILARRILTSIQLTLLQSGTYDQHTTINYTAGSKTVHLRSMLYKRLVDGTEIEIGSSPNSNALTSGTYQQVEWTGSITSDTTFETGEFLRMNLIAVVSGGGSAPTISLIVENGTAARLDININPTDLIVSDASKINISDEENLNVNSSNYWDGETSQSNLNVNNSATADAFTINPSDCAANQFADEIAANGDLTCNAIIDADVPNDITIDLSSVATTWASVSSFISEWFYDNVNVLTFNTTRLTAFIEAFGYSTTTGTVTSIATGYGLTGGTITGSGNISTVASTAGASQYSYWDGDSWEVRNDVDTDTQDLSYDAGTDVISLVDGGSIDITEVDTDTQLSNESVEDIVGGMLGGTETFITVTYEDATGDIDFVVTDNWWDADGDISADEISESKINFVTACAAGNHYYLSGNDLACEADANTQYTATGGVTLVGTIFNHTDTSSQTDSDNSGRTYIQDIILDTMGHLISIVTATETVVDTDTQDLSYDAGTDVISLVDGGSIDITEVDTDTTYSAGGAYQILSSTTFSVNETALNNTIIIITDERDTDTTYTATGGVTLVGTVFNHTDTSSQSSSDNSARVYIQDLILDTMGHITSLVTATETVTDTQLSNESVEDITGDMWTGNTETGITVTYQDADGTIDAVVDFTSVDECSEITNCVPNAWDADADISADEISESKINFVTACAAGNHYYLSGNDLACEADADTTYTNGSGITLVGTTFNHSDTSSQADSDNSGRTYIQDIILDTFGHLISLVTATETVVDTDTQDLSYDAGTDVISLVDGGSIDISEVDTNTQLSNENVEDITGAMVSGNTETFITVTYQDADGTIDFEVTDNWWNADADISIDTISESKIIFSTACASGNHYYLSGNDLACEADTVDTNESTRVDALIITENDNNNTQAAQLLAQDACNEITNCVPNAWDADADISADEISESKIAFSTVCASGNHYYLNGNDLACEADANTQYTANGLYIFLSGTTITYNESKSNNTIIAITDARDGEGVTSVAAGNGMDFTTITATGSVVMGTPSAVTGSSSNAVTATSHTHSATTDDTGDCAAGVICGGGHSHSDKISTSSESSLNVNSADLWDALDSPTAITALGTISSATSITSSSFVGPLTGTASVATSWDGETSQTNLNVNNSATADALTINPTDCGANQFADSIVASGNLGCNAIIDADIPNDISIDLASTATFWASVSSFIGEWFYDNANVFTFNTTRLTAFIEAFGYSTTTGTVTAVTGTSPIVSSGGATPIISATIAKDLVTNFPLTGAADNIFLGVDSDVTIGITVLKDLVTTTPLSGGVNNILTGSDSDVTIAISQANTNTDGYVSQADWNTFNSKADSDTTYSAGNGISLSTTTFSVAGNTCLDQDADGLSVTAGCIGDTQIDDNYINQALKTTSAPSFSTVSLLTNLIHTGDTHTQISFLPDEIEIRVGGVPAVSASTVEVVINDFDQNIDFRVVTNNQVSAFIIDAGTDTATFNVPLSMGSNAISSVATLDTGEGPNELFDMDQNVLTSSDVDFNSLRIPVGKSLFFGTSNDYCIFHNGTSLIINNNETGITCPT